MTKRLNKVSDQTSDIWVAETYLGKAVTTKVQSTVQHRNQPCYLVLIHSHIFLLRFGLVC